MGTGPGDMKRRSREAHQRWWPFPISAGGWSRLRAWPSSAPLAHPTGGQAYRLGGLADHLQVALVELHVQEEAVQEPQHCPAEQPAEQRGPG